MKDDDEVTIGSMFVTVGPVPFKVGLTGQHRLTFTIPYTLNELRPEDMDIVQFRRVLTMRQRLGVLIARNMDIRPPEKFRPLDVLVCFGNATPSAPGECTVALAPLFHMRLEEPTRATLVKVLQDNVEKLTEKDIQFLFRRLMGDCRLVIGVAQTKVEELPPGEWVQFLVEQEWYADLPDMVVRGDAPRDAEMARALRHFSDSPVCMCPACQYERHVRGH